MAAPPLILRISSSPATYALARCRSHEQSEHPSIQFVRRHRRAEGRAREGERSIQTLSTTDIYKELILDYYRNPRNFGKLQDHDIEARETNPLCGDEVDIQIKVGKGEEIEKIRYTGKGCAISQSSTSLLTELAKDKPLDWVRQLSKEDIFKMLGNPDLGPSRVKCALLGMKALKVGVYGYLGTRLGSNEE